MADILIPSQIEHAYHLGWVSYFDDPTGTGLLNPYKGELAECWEDGWQTAEIIAASIAVV